MSPADPTRTGDAAPADPGRVRRGFERASATYDEFAVLQGRVREELLARLDLLKLEPRVVLDLGCGTGLGTRALKDRYRRAHVIGADLAPAMLAQAGRQSRLFRRFSRVCANAARLPFADGSVDVVFTSLMLQWCLPPDAVFAEVRRVLRPTGFFAFSTFGPDTLRELRAAWAAVDAHAHVNDFLDMHDIGDALGRAGLAEPVLDVDRVRLTYPDVRGLMRDLKAIGASTVTAGRAPGLTGPGRLRAMTAAYERFRGADGRLPATYEVVYGAAWGHMPRPGRPAGPGGEVTIPAGSIRRRNPA